MTTMTRDQVLETVREARAVGQRAELAGTNLAYATLREADLSRAVLVGTDLTGADLTGADLTGTYLTGTYLRGATLTGAVLSHAVLSRADLTGADLTNAGLTDAWLNDAKVRPEQLLDCRGLQPAWAGHRRLPWDELLPTNPEKRQLIEHLLNDGWNGTLREAIETVEGLTGR